MSNNASPSFDGKSNFNQQGDRIYRLVYTLKIGDKSTDEDSYLASMVDNININERLSGSDTLTVVIKDTDFFKDNSLINSCFVKVKDTIVELKYNWKDSIGTVQKVRYFKGYVSAMDLDFPSDGIPTMTLTCLDYFSQKMNTKKYKKTWSNVTSADVVKDIAKSYGYDVEIEDYNFRKRDTISQSGQTDIEFLESLARGEFEPFICKVFSTVKNGKETAIIKYIRKRVDKNAVAGFSYKTRPYNIISFNPQLNRETRKEEITDSDINVTNKQVVTEVANNSTPRVNEGGIDWDKQNNRENSSSYGGDF